MNAKQLIAAAAVFATAGSTFAAGNTEYVDFSSFQSTKTRAEVRAEIQQGQLAQNKEFVEFTSVASGKSRDDVRKEVDQAARTPRVDSTYFGG